MSISKLGFWFYDEVLRKRPTLRYLREYEQQQWGTIEEIRRLQLQKLRALVEHAAREVPFFRELVPKIGLARGISSLEDLKSFPIMTKELVRAGYDQFLAASMRGDCVRKATGGSTGDPFQFQYNRDSDFRRLAVMWRGYRWGGADIGRRSAFIWSWPYAGKSGSSLLREQLYQRILGRTYFNIFELSDEKLPDIAQQLAKLRPEVIVSYVSGGLTLARWMLENRFSIPAPRGIITGAEALHEPDRLILQKAFGAPVFNTYGGREFMLIAAECDRHNGLHVSADHMVVETVDEKGKNVVGEPGRVLITDLHNFGMPFIRYANGDVATLDSIPCQCGRGLPLMRSVQGREADVVRLPDGRRLTGLFFVHLFKDFDGIRYYKVVQHRLDEIQVLLVPMAESGERIVAAVQATLRRELGPAVRVTVEIVEHMPLTAAGKRRIVESRLGAG